MTDKTKRDLSLAIKEVSNALKTGSGDKFARLFVSLKLLDDLSNALDEDLKSKEKQPKLDQKKAGPKKKKRLKKKG